MNLTARISKLEVANAARVVMQSKYAGGSPLEIYKRMLNDTSYCPGNVTTAATVAGDITPEQAYRYLVTGKLP